jgi:antitoxin CptB
LSGTSATAADRRDLARLRWRCRRGMRELDSLLTRYLDTTYPRAAPVEREAFARLLELPDPDLFGYLVGRTETAEGPLRDVVARIRNPAY